MTEKPDKMRGPQQPDPESVGLPVRVFLYTLDQVAMLLSLEEDYVANRGLVHYVGRSTGVPSRDQMQAKNIAPSNLPPEWRIAESELIRYCKRRGVMIYVRGWAKA